MRKFSATRFHQSAIRNRSKRDLFDDFQPIAVEADDAPGGAGEQTDFTQAERNKDLRPDAIVAKAGRRSGTGGVLLFETVERIPAGVGLLEIKDDTLARPGHRIEGTDERTVAVHAFDAKNVAEQVFAMHPHEQGIGAEAAHGEGQMVAAIQLVAEDVKGELPEFGRERPGADKLDQPIALGPVLDELRDGNHVKAEFLLEFDQLGQPLDGAVVVNQLAQHAAWLQAGQQGQIHRSLGVPGAFEHAARTSSQGKNMAGLHQLFRPGLRIGQDADRLGPVAGADTGGDAFGGVHAYGEIGALGFAVLGNHRPEAQPPQLRFDGGNADDAAAVADHHIDFVRRDGGGRHDEIALVFPVLVVGHDDEPAGGDVLNGRFDQVERRGGIHAAGKNRAKAARCQWKRKLQMYFSGCQPRRGGLSLPAFLFRQVESAMRFRVRHRTLYRYTGTASESFMEARLTPVSDGRQKLLGRRLVTAPASRIHVYTDYFGNAVETFSIVQRHAELVLESRAEVETLAPEASPAALEANVSDARQLYRGERLRLFEFLTPSPAIPLSAPVHALARQYFSPRDVLGDSLLRFLAWMHGHFEYAPDATAIDTPIASVLKTRAGVCQDFAQIMIAVLRSAEIPARYVTGYIETESQRQAAENGSGSGRRSSRLVGASESHAWVEVYLPGGCWHPLDPTNNCVAGERHVKVGCGRDYHDCTPTRGVFKGTRTETLEVAVSMQRF